MEIFKDEIKEEENEELKENDSLEEYEDNEDFYSPTPILDIMEEGFGRLDDKFNLLMREFTGKLKYDAQKDRQIDRLHEELQKYREDLLLKSILPMIQDMIFEIEANKKKIAQLKAKEVSELNPLKLLNILEDYPEELSNILYRQGIESFESLGETFDGKKHSINKIIETPDKEKNNTIAFTVRPGYRWEEKLIKKEMVNIYKYYKPIEKEETMTN